MFSSSRIFCCVITSWVIMTNDVMCALIRVNDPSIFAARRGSMSSLTGRALLSSFPDRLQMSRTCIYSVLLMNICTRTC